MKDKGPNYWGLLACSVGLCVAWATWTLTRLEKMAECRVSVGFSYVEGK